MEIDWTKAESINLDPRLIALPETQTVKQSELEATHPQGTIYVCDCYLDGIENTGAPVIGGFQSGRCINIDHHAPVKDMSRVISSTPLAIKRVRQQGSVTTQDWVAINHFDCDSVLSSAIMLGILPPLDQFAEAAIAADHTGQANDIADLLQPCDKARDFVFSMRNLAKLCQNQPLDEQAQMYFDQQRLERHQAKELVSNDTFTILPGGVAWAQLPTKIDSAFFPALLPQAKVILLVCPLPSGNKCMNIRLGLTAPQGLSLHQLAIQDFDPAFGSRWNAGSNSRAGGSPLTAQNYAQQLDQHVQAKISQ
jgi:hypothetical protein